MDEPFGAPDALIREKVQKELHSVWHRSGMAMMFITDSVEEAVCLGTDVLKSLIWQMPQQAEG